jgi:hypothetical protein
MSNRRYITAHGKRIEIETLDFGQPTGKKNKCAEFAVVELDWIADMAKGNRCAWCDGPGRDALFSVESQEPNLRFPKHTSDPIRHRSPHQTAGPKKTGGGREDQGRAARNPEGADGDAARQAGVIGI